MDVVELARQIAARMDPEALLDADDVSAMIKCEKRTFMARFAPAPGFPKALRLTATDGRSHPRWKRSEILAWIDSHQNGAKKTGGRPRSNPSDF